MNDVLKIYSLSERNDKYEGCTSDSIYGTSNCISHINKTPYLTFSIHNSREKLNGDNFSVITFLNQTIYGLNTCILPGIHRY